MKTKFAPAEREAIEQIREDLFFLERDELVTKLINSMPTMGAILNSHRQIVYANRTLLETLELKVVEDIVGSRPGEALHCVNAGKEIGGCGTSKNCSVCGAVNCILEAQKNKQKSVRECRINTLKNGTYTAYDFLVTTSPFTWQEETYYVFSLTDISNEKRRRALERIFFHDVINKTGSMLGLIELLKQEKDVHKIKEFIQYLDMLNSDLNNEIEYQRELASAESGELIVDKAPTESLHLIETAAIQIRNHEVAHTKNVLVDENADHFTITTDATILRRVLMNMLKNALEATPKEGTVKIGATSEKNNLRFWVHNPQFIPEESQLQIFQRSFSTKGRGRGLGTYSMKLLGETYLKGTVDFSSEANRGTTFYIEFPNED